ncbi:MAG: PAS domain-containing protein [Candidatus Altiarchaeota archaeon]
MDLAPETKMGALFLKYPYLLDFLLNVSPKYDRLRNPLVRKTMGNIATLQELAGMGGVDVANLIRALNGEIQRNEGGKGAGNIAPHAEGPKPLDVFQAAEKAGVKVQAPQGHLIDTYLSENAQAQKVMSEIDGLVGAVGTWDNKTFSAVKHVLAKHIERLSENVEHYANLEARLFPILESKGYVEPMKGLRAREEDARTLLRLAKKQVNESAPASITTLRRLMHTMRDQIKKEEYSLLPGALSLMSADEWDSIRPADVSQSDGSPLDGFMPKPSDRVQVTGGLDMDVGNLTHEQVNLLLKSLPLDVTFVDENDIVVYYNQGTRQRITARNPDSIGSRIQSMYPAKAGKALNRLIEEFKSGQKDADEYWLQLRGKFVCLRFFALRGSDGRYRGMLEVAQDATGIRLLEGEKRLTD